MATFVHQNVVLYPKNNTLELDLELFRNPTAEYRGAPFWSWNTKLDLAQLLRQMAIFKSMGMGGVCIHARTGLATEYLGAEFLRLVRACVEQAQRDEMLVWLYDEDRYPSGYQAASRTGRGSMVQAIRSHSRVSSTSFIG